MLNLKLLTVIAFILTAGISYDEAFGARAGSEFSNPTQQNAYASYNIATNDVQVSWNFNTLPVDTTCLLKGDFVWYEDLNADHNSGVADVDYDKVTGFIPKYYSVVSDSPTIIGSGNGHISEVVPCENGSIRIDLDIIMSHSKNINNYKDLEIFLSFYVANADGSLNLADASRIDEVFVLFTPTNTFDNAAQEYGCGGQIGSTLYIDQSAERIHGNNGDNCIGAEFEYVALNSNEWVNLGMDDSPGLALGVELKGDHTEPFFSLLIQVVEEIIAIIQGGSSDDHNSRPTFGIDYKTFTQLVDEGLVINDKVYTVTDNYWTPMDMLSLEVGVTQNFTSTVFAPHQLKILEFAFGIPEVGKWNESEATIEIETNYDGEVVDFKINEYTSSPIINPASLEYDVSKVKCNANDNTEPCYRVSIEFSFLESPIGNVLALQAIDNERKNQILYFNDGLEITGESLNPPTIQKIISEIKYKGLQTIQRIDKETDVWITLDTSEPVLHYLRNGHGTFIPIEYRMVDPSVDEVKMNMDRLNSEFKYIITYEINRATKIFDSQLIQGQDPTSWSYDYTTTERMNKNSDAIQAEKIRVLEVYEQMFTEYEKPNSNFKE